MSSGRPTLDDTPRTMRCSSPSSPAPTPCSTPLLTASLNAPPQSYYPGGGVRVKCPTDLQLSLAKAKSKDQEGEQAVFYSTLLKQLRHKVGGDQQGPSGHQQQLLQKIKVKEKGGKALPFQCPACKKRFQRHIAMNAHIQNEHISPASVSGERSCRLCGVSRLR